MVSFANNKYIHWDYSVLRDIKGLVAYCGRPHCCAVIMEAKEKKENSDRCKDSREKFMELQGVVQIEDGKVVFR